MRCVAIAVLAGCTLFLQAAPSLAQKTKSPPKKGEAEPTAEMSEIGGKALEEWIAGINAKDPSQRENAIRTVLLFGPERAREAVPVLITALKQHSFSYPLDISVRTNATLALGIILGNIRDPNERQVKDAVVLLKRMLTDSQDIVKYRAAQALAQLGSEAKIAVPVLLYTVKDQSNWETRQAAATALGRLAMPPTPPKGEKLKLTPQDQQDIDKAVTELSNRVRLDPSFQVRLTCLHGLVGLGPLADRQQIRPLMEKALEHAASTDPEITVRIWAHVTIMAIGKIDYARMKWIGTEMVNSKDRQVRLQAAQALALMNKEAKSQVHHLAQALDDSDKAVASTSLIALAQVGEEGWNEIGKALVTNKDALIRAAAAQVLGSIGTKAKLQIPSIEKGLSDADKNVQAASMAALAHMGEGGVAQVGKLLAESKKAPIRLQAAQALAGAGTGAKTQLPVLLAALGDTDKDVVVATTVALAQLGKAAADAVPPLRKLAASSDYPEVVRQQVFNAAIDAIEGKIDPKELRKGPPEGAQR